MPGINFTSQFTVSGKTVGIGAPVFIIAEIGVNHNGDMELAKKMIEAAASAGVDAVKFQTFRANSFMVDTGQVYEYRVAGQMVRESTYGMMKRLELPDNEHKALFEHARLNGVIPLTSVTEPHSVDVAVAAGIEIFKIASADLTNYPLLEALGRENRPVIVSTGMATEDEIIEARAILEKAGLRDCVFLHCVSLYPTPDSEANLLRMHSLKRLTQSPMGYSDHTVGEEACAAAIAMGACVLEKHFTLDKNLPGPDHAFSADPEDLRRLVERVRRVECLLGAGEIAPGEKESVARSTFRPSVTAAEDLPIGAIIAKEHLCLKWPGGGIHPSKMDELIGRVLAKPVGKDEQLHLDMLEKQTNHIQE